MENSTLRDFYSENLEAYINEVGIRYIVFGDVINRYEDLQYFETVGPGVDDE